MQILDGPVKAIGAGSLHSVALKEDGTVVAWGDGSSGAITIPAGLTNVKSISVGTITVVLKEDGTVVAWGSNIDGKSTVPAGLIGVTAISTGLLHTLALKEDGTLVTWGNNRYGQTIVPAGLTGVIAIAAGSNHTVALLDHISIGVTSAIKNNLPNVYLSLVEGRIMLSTPLRSGTITLFNLNGKILFNSQVSGSSLNLPANIGGGMVFWKINHAKVSTAGRLFLKQ